MKILSPAISRLARLRSWKIEQWLVNPFESQREVMQNLITHAQHSEFGRRFNFKNIFNENEFKANVPLQEYEDLKPYIQRLMAGEQYLLWNTPVNWFAKSSGTTSDKSKFIPVTNENMEECHYQGAKDVLTLYYNGYPESDLLLGKGLVIGGSHQINSLNDEIHYGDLSAILLQNTPFWSQWIRTPELAIALMDEWETKIESIANATINENVTSISGVPTWTMVLIKRILEITGKSTLKEVWPQLEVYIHGGVSFLPYKDQLDNLIGEPIHYLEMYNASEGFFAAQSHPNEDGMLLYLNHGIFYEFLPLEEYGKDNPKTLNLKEIELNKNYAMVISTSSGLWRYVLGDTIQFTTLNPFRIKVTGRIKHYINAFGEEVIIDNADKAIAKASKKTNALVTDYSAAPVYFTENNNGAHEWLIEFEKEPENLQQFALELDKSLREINSDYDAKRYKDIALSSPQIVILPKGTWGQWLKSKGKLGGQHKVPRLSNNRKYVDEIKEMLKDQWPHIRKVK